MLPIKLISNAVVSKNNTDLNHNPQDNYERFKQIILLPYDYIIQNPGKNFRSKLFTAINNWLNVSDEHLALVNEVIEMLHNASLIHDDIEDNSTTRRGLPVAHQIFGIPLSINAGTFVLISALDLLTKKLPSDKLDKGTKLFSKHILECHIGQGLDIYWRDSYSCPSEDDYLYMIECKTAGLFGLGVSLMQLLSDNKVDCMPFIKHLGKYFQIRDDYANLKLTEYEISKGFAEDLTEGKFSFPIIHGILKHPEDITLLTILKQRTTNISTKRYAISLLEKFGSLSYTYETVHKLDKECRKMAEQLGDNPQINKVFEMLKI